MTRSPRRTVAGSLLAFALLFPGLAARAADEPAADTMATASDDLTVDYLKGLLDGLTEQIQTQQADLDKLKKIKFTGYIQARSDWSQTSADTVRAAGTLTAANADRFYIRRCRLKATYDSSPLSQAVLSVDGGADRTVRLLEAYVTLMDPWTVLHGHQLTMGQFNVPFGYEIERSSSVRELPERSRAENVLFSGERDRGAKLIENWTTRLQTTVALLNGGGINHPDFPNADPTRGKDWVMRGRYVGGIVDVAASYYTGRNLVPLTGPDVIHDKTRLGFDAQGYYQLPALGGGSLKGEFYQGHEVNPDSVSSLLTGGATANPRLLKAGADGAHLATDMRGGYAMWVQNLGEKVQVAARYEGYDPNVDASHDQYQRTSLAAHYFYDGSTRLTVAYEAPRTEKKVSGAYIDPADNLWTVQVQHKF